MKEIIITPAQDGQKLITAAARYLKEAPDGFLYKMLRKKNITLNGKKATGKEHLKTGDVIRFWFSDETIARFTGEEPAGEECTDQDFVPDFPEWILYEDENVLLVNKPAGILSQKAEVNDVSLNEMVIDYLLRTGQTSMQQLQLLRPSVCNRLDRNTSGIVAVGKTHMGLRLLTELFRERDIHKEYLCLVCGRIDREDTLHAWWEKDSAGNQAHISLSHDGSEGSGKEIITKITPVRSRTDENGNTVTLLKVLLITGRSHQIRAHLSALGHPVIGDAKYGNRTVNRYYQRTYGVKSQLLHAFRITFPDQTAPPLDMLAGMTVTAPLPKVFAGCIGEIGEMAL